MGSSFCQGASFRTPNCISIPFHSFLKSCASEWVQSRGSWDVAGTWLCQTG